MRILVTGSAGFIGHALCLRLLAEGHEVTGFDGVTAFSDASLKRARLADLAGRPGFAAIEALLEAPGALAEAVGLARPELVFHLAAQAGVRYSLENPKAYVDANLVGVANVLEALRAHPPRHFLFASTSSAYGGDAHPPFRETDRATTPLTLYAASKIAGEAMAHSYAHLFAIPTTMFRFFTVYGPWGRPDMAVFLFARKIAAGELIEMFGEGRLQRDFTYVDDLVEAIRRLADAPPPAPGEGGPVGPEDTLSPVAPYRLVNIGGGRPRPVADMVALLEQALGRAAVRVPRPLPPGDVPLTHASTALLERLVGHIPETPLEVGIPAFARWFRAFYGA